MHERHDTNEWVTVPLGTLAQFRNGLNYTKDNFGRGVKVINVKDFQNHFIAKFQDLDEINPKGVVRESDLLREGDIIFVRSNGNRELIGRSLFVQTVNEPVSHSAFSIKLRFTSERAFPKFYAYLFRSYLIRQALSAQGNGTNISNLNQGILSSLIVPVPPIESQRRIAAILSAYDDLIENNTRRIQLLEEMARRIYEEWFVRFRFPGHENVRLTESELGPIPEGWEVVAVGKLLEHQIGGGWGEEAETAESTIAAFVIRGTDIPSIRQGSLGKAPLRYHKPTNFKSRKLEMRDIVFEISGGSKDQPVGRTVLISEDIIRKSECQIICASFCRLVRA